MTLIVGILAYLLALALVLLFNRGASLPDAALPLADRVDPVAVDPLESADGLAAARRLVGAKSGETLVSQ